jgi:hypothetical protein
MQSFVEAVPQTPKVVPDMQSKNGQPKLVG